MLIFRNTPVSETQFQELSPEAMQAELEKWNAWIGGIAAQGKLVSTDALHNTGKTIHGSKHVVTDGPFVESKELVSGYLILQAENEAEAIKHSEGCPIFEVEGSVEVRQLMEFDQQ